MNAWISVKDRLPDAPMNVIVATENGVRVAYLSDVEPHFWREPYMAAVVCGVTHWMPLPPPPEDAVREALRLARQALDWKDMELGGCRIGMPDYIPYALDAIARAEAELDAK